MASVDVLFRPRDAKADSFAGKAVAVFDVLRATTTMTAALASGVSEIRVFPTIDAAQQEACESGLEPKPMLCGERNCVRPEGFDFGNSPGELVREWGANQVLYMATTNGTNALIAARKAKTLFAGAIVNATAVARRLLETGLDVSLLCAGTNAEEAMEDVLGAGAVIEAMERQEKVRLASDRALMARRLFGDAKDRLREVLAQGAGGRNVIAAGLEQDIDFAASLDRFRVVGRVDGGSLRVTL
jgi:2-phosphosulfolactate phosphatase